MTYYATILTVEDTARLVEIANRNCPIQYSHDWDQCPVHELISSDRFACFTRAIRDGFYNEGQESIGDRA
jgi:hypothetical protein